MNIKWKIKVVVVVVALTSLAVFRVRLVGVDETDDAVALEVGKDDLVEARISLILNIL